MSIYKCKWCKNEIPLDVVTDELLMCPICNRKQLAMITSVEQLIVKKEIIPVVQEQEVAGVPAVSNGKVVLREYFKSIDEAKAFLRLKNAPLDLYRNYFSGHITVHRLNCWLNLYVDKDRIAARYKNAETTLRMAKEYGTEQYRLNLLLSGAWPKAKVKMLYDILLSRVSVDPQNSKPEVQENTVPKFKSVADIEKEIKLYSQVGYIQSKVKAGGASLESLAKEFITTPDKIKELVDCTKSDEQVKKYLRYLQDEKFNLQHSVKDMTRDQKLSNERIKRDRY